LRYATLRSPTSRVLALALGVACTGGAAQAQGPSWGAPDRAFAQYGIRSVVCHRTPDTSLCLGLACSRGALALVSVAGGGGPMDGPTRVSDGRSRFTLKFVFDPKAVDRLGLAASRADLTAAQLETLAHAAEITLSDEADPRIHHRFPTHGLAREGRRIAAACGTPAGERR
jgi:hypothetical protein